MHPRLTFVVLAVLTTVYVASAAVLIAYATGSAEVVDRAAVALVSGTGLVLAWLIARRVVTSPVPSALGSVSALAVLVPAIERAGRSAATSDPWPAAQLAEPLVQAIWPWQLVGFVLVLLVFPSETLRRPVAVRALVAGGAALLLILVGNWGTQPGGDFAGWRVPVAVLGLAALVVSVALAAVDLVRRSRRAGPVARQQTRWLLLAAVAVVGTMIVSWVTVPQVVPADVGYGAFLVAIYVLVPGAVAIAVIRYQLYDIDRIINRTLVYGSLTVTLAGTYVGTVLLLQLMLSGITEGSGFAVAVSTLVVAALFRPARVRVQQVVDRRFFRSRYDAARTLESFGARVRHQVDLGALSGDLQTVAAEAMQPTHVSLWLRPESHRVET